jgi:hypothetical protein
MIATRSAPKCEDIWVTDLQSVGVFHFGDTDRGCPVRSLEHELEKSEGIANSLVVLPEAFNIPDGYHVGTGPTPSVRSNLLLLSEKYQAAFVAGLIEEQPARGFVKGFNSAYLIDAAAVDNFKLISQKRIDCRAEICSSNPHAQLVTVCHRGIGIAILICNDFIHCDENTREELFEHVGWSECAVRVLCVPACSTTHMRTLIGASEQWKEYVCVAAANGDNRDLSFINGKWVAERRMIADRRSGSVQADGSFDDRWGYPYNEILMSPLPRVVAR